MRMVVLGDDPRGFVGEGHQRIALGAGIPPARGFPQKKDHERKHQTEADGKSEGYD
jgi:hypothetical protein